MYQKDVHFYVCRNTNPKYFLEMWWLGCTFGVLGYISQNPKTFASLVTNILYICDYESKVDDLTNYKLYSTFEMAI